MDAILANSSSMNSQLPYVCLSFAQVLCFIHFFFKSMSSRFYLQNGALVEWQFPDAFNPPVLQVVTYPPAAGTKDADDANPWNWMTDNDIENVRNHRPDKKIQPCKIDSMMFHKVYASTKDLAVEIQEIIGADCWGLFTTRSDRSQIVKVYFDHRTNQTEQDGDQKERTRLLEDPSDLIRDIDHGNLTLVIILGDAHFMEYYIFKVAANTYLSVCVDHSINC